MKKITAIDGWNRPKAVPTLSGYGFPGVQYPKGDLR